MSYTTGTGRWIEHNWPKLELFRRREVIDIVFGGHTPIFTRREWVKVTHDMDAETLARFASAVEAVSLKKEENDFEDMVEALARVIREADLRAGPKVVCEHPDMCKVCSTHLVLVSADCCDYGGHLCSNGEDHHNDGPGDICRQCRLF